jgi:hypothetical protein
MQFQIVRDAIISVLGADAALLPAENQFRVIGYQRQAEDAKTALLASVQVFYDTGEFPKSGGSFVGDSVKHKTRFRLELTVAGKSKGDLSGLDSGTPAGVAAALATFQEAAKGVDDAIDQLWSNLWNILMDAKNETYGLAIGAVSSRWVDGFKKDQPTPKGEIVVLTANASLTCDVDESVIGIEGILGTSFDVTFDDINGDIEQKTGASGTLGGD